MLLYTTETGIPLYKRPVDELAPGTALNYNGGGKNIPAARYYRKTRNCDTSCKITRVVKVADCNACKVKRSASTVLSKNYYQSRSEYLKARCRTYEQGLLAYNRSADGTITKDCCDDNNNCGVYKRSNAVYGETGAVSGSERILRTKYNTVSSQGKYIGDTNYNIQFKPQATVCHRRDGVKNVC